MDVVLWKLESGVDCLLKLASQVYCACKQITLIKQIILMTVCELHVNGKTLT